MPRSLFLATSSWYPPGRQPGESKV
jgi:hypothetical protein